MIFKVDFEKAFYSMRWDYLDDELNKFGFEVKWCGWIHGCLNSAMVSILINGSLTTKFKFYKVGGLMSRRSSWEEVIGKLLAFICSFKNIYPRLITLELEKNISIAVKMRDASLVYSFRRVPRGGIGEDHVTRLRNNLSHVLLSQSIDRWVWKIESSGDFSIKSARSFIDDSLLAKADVPARWVKAVPIRINL
nr:RNA-directed DNA polymerase, eukaryota, reverse transcriptase zinc-binding domain protein [Tanacetum cinerariifolium]